MGNQPVAENNTAERRPRHGFQKGKSGNPGGRPKAIKDLQERARAHTAAALKALSDALTDEDARVRVAAAQALLDRGWGKAPQAITGPDGEKLALSITIDLGGAK